MSARTKGPRLYWRKGRPEKRQADVWVIRDGQTEVSTGCGSDGYQQAEQALAAYIAAKWKPEARSADRPGDPASVFVAEVIALYSQEKAPKSPDPVSLRGRLQSLLDWWGDKTLADIKRSTCEAYVAWRILQPIKSFTKSAPRFPSPQTARRDLEDLSAAIGYWHGEHPLTRIPKVTLPPKPESPRDALTRAQAARLLMACRGYRWMGDGKWKKLEGSIAANRRHLRRFILLGIYTGTRPGVMPKLLWHESPSQAWVDLDDGIVYRRGREERDHATKRRPLVRVPRRLLAHMKRWKAQDDRVADLQDQGEHAPTKRRAKPNQRASTVLHHGGRPLAGRIRTGFEGVVRDAGLEGEVTPHWMRHTCVTWLMERGVSIWDAAGYTGMTATMIEKNYGHHRPDHQNSAVKALSR